MGRCGLIPTSRAGALLVRSFTPWEGKNVSAKKKYDGPLSAEQVIEAMRYLGYITYDEQGTTTNEAYHVGRELAGKVKENVMLPVLIAQEVDKFRKSA